MGKKVQGIRSIHGRHKTRQEEVKNGIGNRDVKELVCTTHGHELRGECGLDGGTGWRGVKAG